MLVWIASYPRSGNAMTRRLIQSGLKLAAETLHHHPRDQWFDLISGWQASPDLNLVKTHAQPTGDPAIYIVRDGRAAIASYRRFISDVHHREFRLAAVVRGSGVGSWSDHVNAWAFKPRTLLTSYERICLQPEQELRRIANFLGKPVVAPPDTDFLKAKTKRPDLCRHGRNEPGIAELEADCSELFWRLHGQTMARLGYARHPARAAADGTAISPSPPI
jgi:hypothetical protein